MTFCNTTSNIYHNNGIIRIVTQSEINFNTDYTLQIYSLSVQLTTSLLYLKISSDNLIVHPKHEKNY